MSLTQQWEAIEQRRRQRRHAPHAPRVSEAIVMELATGYRNGSIAADDLTPDLRAAVAEYLVSHRVHTKQVA